MEGDSELAKAIAISLIVLDQNERAANQETMRLDLHEQPIAEKGGVICRPGSPYPLGPSFVRGIDGINFAVLSTSSTMSLCLFLSQDGEGVIEVPMRSTQVAGQIPIWHLFVQGLPGFTLYGYRPSSSLICADPYCKLLFSSGQWGSQKVTKFQLGHVAIEEEFDWEGDSPPDIPAEDMIISKAAK